MNDVTCLLDAAAAKIAPAVRAAPAPAQPTPVTKVVTKLVAVTQARVIPPTVR